MTFGAGGLRLLPQGGLVALLVAVRRVVCTVGRGGGVTMFSLPTRPDDQRSACDREIREERDKKRLQGSFNRSSDLECHEVISLLVFCIRCESQLTSHPHPPWPPHAGGFMFDCCFQHNTNRIIITTIQ